MVPGLYQTQFESVPNLTLLITYRICFYLKKGEKNQAEENSLGLL